MDKTGPPLTPGEVPVRVRIAPSPTGNLHVGTARAALFNELFARKEGGTFVLRIEDTDKKRSKPEYEQSIIEGLKWLGLEWQEGPDRGGDYGPYRQSERTSLYQAAIEKLLAEDKAYREGEAVRLRVEPQEVVFEDLVRGEVKTHSDSWGGDFVIARSLTDPVFHLAVVIDDAAMQISHVIRGEDHISNTARHILIQRALGHETPQYAHLPLLLDETRKKLSKRSGETDLLAYRDMGYLPEAMLNYLALLGWNPGDDREFFTHEELAKAFSFEGVQKAGAIFSLTKLQAVNKEYIRRLPPADLLTQAKPFLEKAGFSPEDEKYWQAAIATEQERVATLGDLPEALAFFHTDWASDFPPELLVWRKSDAQATKAILKKLIEKVGSLSEENFSAERLEKELLTWIEAEELGNGDTLWPMRVALTGREHSPGPFEVAAILGKKETLARLQKAYSILMKSGK